MADRTTRIGAVVLAGGQVPPSLAHRCDYRALLKVRGRYLLAFLFDTLRAAPSIVATALVAPAAALSPLGHLPDHAVAAGDHIVENMRRGADALLDDRVTHLLFITGDIPLLTVAGVEAYLADSLRSGAALTYPIIPRAACERRFPGGRRTYVRLREDTFTGGNAIFAEAHLLDERHALIQQLYRARKNPLQLAQILGVGTVGRLLTGTLTLPYLEQVASRLLLASVRAIVTPYPELGFDVDKLDDLAAVEQALGE